MKVSNVTRRIPQLMPTLNCPRCLLRLASTADVEGIIHYYQANQAPFAPFEPTRDATFYTANFWLREVAARQAAMAEDRAVKLFIFARDKPSQVIGSVNFSNVIRGNFQSCTLGYSLATDKQGQGYMTEALTEAIRYMFEEQDLHRIAAAYLPENHRSGRLLRRLGFTIEGYAPDYVKINDRWQDHILTSLTFSQWQQHRDRRQ